MIDKSKIPQEVLKTLYILKDNGYQSYLVGGCIRDLIMKRAPKDYDICTNATPDEIMSIFEPTHKVIPTGIRYGTITLIADNFYIDNAIGIPIEVTTYRKDGNYSDGRRPDSVNFGVNFIDDISRRDFRMNSILYDGDSITDPLGGINNIDQKIISTVGNPSKRFREDALRMMRAIRFACQLDFEIEGYAFEGIQLNAKLIKNVSNERIRDELTKILLSNNPSLGINLLEESGLLKYIIPELNDCVGFDQRNPHHDKDVFKHTLRVLESTPKGVEIRLVALLHDVAKPITFSIGEDGIGHFYSHHMKGFDMVKNILTGLKFDNKTIENVSILVMEHMSRYPNLRKSSIKKLINRVGIVNIDNLINLQIADIIGSIPPYDFQGIVNFKNEVYRILNTKEPLTVKDLDINGYDLIKLGMKPGKEMGIVLNQLLEIVLENPEINTKNQLIEKVKPLLHDLQ